MWGVAMFKATYLMNRSPPSGLGDKTPALLKDKAINWQSLNSNNVVNYEKKDFSILTLFKHPFHIHTIRNSEQDYLSQSLYCTS